MGPPTLWETMDDDTTTDALDLVRPDNPRNHDRVHTFTADEIRRLYLACETLMEKILMDGAGRASFTAPGSTALFTTGMRIGQVRSGSGPGPTASVPPSGPPEAGWGTRSPPSRRGTCA